MFSNKREISEKGRNYMEVYNIIYIKDFMFYYENEGEENGK